MIDRKSIPITRIKKKLFVDKEMTKKNLSHVKKNQQFFCAKHPNIALLIFLKNHTKYLKSFFLSLIIRLLS